MASSFKDTTIEGNLTVSGSLELGSLVLMDALSVTNGTYTFDGIRFYDNSDNGQYGFGACFDAEGTTIIGAGGSGIGLTETVPNNSDNLYLSAKDHIYFYPDISSITKYAYLDSSLNFAPYSNNVGSLGTSSAKWNYAYVNGGYFGSIDLEGEILMKTPGEYIRLNTSSGSTYCMIGCTTSDNIAIGATDFPGKVNVYGATGVNFFTSASDGTIKLLDRYESQVEVFAAGRTSAGQFIRSAPTVSKTTSASANLVLNAAGVFYKYSSASKYKLNIDNIAEDEFYPYRILRINPRQWFDKNAIESYSNYMTLKNSEDVELSEEEKSNLKSDLADVSLDTVYGLVAEDVEEAGLGKYCTYAIKDEDTKTIEGLQYDKLTTLLIPIVRDLVLSMQEIIPEVKKDITDQDVLNKINKLESKFNSFKEEDIINTQYQNQ